jgi:glycosyltransferase involved in cell wall biosynthesis
MHETIAPEVSIIVTCYNLQDYIGAALQSIKDQTYGGKIQTIVIDDASSDRSGERIAAFTNIVFERNSHNRGVLASMLTGLEHADADIIFMLDGDDIWERIKIEESVKVFVKDPSVGFLTHDIRYIGPDGAELNRKSVAGRRPALLDPMKASDEIRRGILQLEDYVWLGSAFAFRRSLINLDQFVSLVRSEGFEEIAYQDWPLAFWIAVQKNADTRYLPLPLMRYRLHGRNHSGGSGDHKKMAKNSRKLLATMQLIRRITEVFDQPMTVRKRVTAGVVHSEFMVALYEGRRFEALRTYIGFALGPRRIGASRLKELVRLLIVSIVGPQLGTRLISHF